MLPIFKVCHGEAFELHHVLCKRASLVAKDVVHHSKFLVQIRGLDSSLKSSRLITDFDVYRDEVGLNKVDHLKSNKERNGDKVHQSDEPDSSLLGDLRTQVLIIVCITGIDVPVCASSKVCPD